MSCRTSTAKKHFEPSRLKSSGGRPPPWSKSGSRPNKSADLRPSACARLEVELGWVCWEDQRLRSSLVLAVEKGLSVDMLAFSDSDTPSKEPNVNSCGECAGGTECGHPRTKRSQAKMVKTARLSSLWISTRNLGPLSAQVIARVRLPVLVIIALILGYGGLKAGATEISDVSLRSGIQLKDRVGQAFKNANFGAAYQYFSEKDLSLNFEGIVEVRFRADHKPEFYDLLLVPFIQPNRDAGTTYLVVLAETPKSSRVLLGTISIEAKTIEVKEESIVVDGKIQPGQGTLKNFLKCSAGGCATAGLGCLYGGPDWLPCFCLWCGGSLVACGLTELFFP
jgi:hypothetical protein